MEGWYTYSELLQQFGVTRGQFDAYVLKHSKETRTTGEGVVWRNAVGPDGQHETYYCWNLMVAGDVIEALCRMGGDGYEDDDDWRRVEYLGQWVKP